MSTTTAAPSTCAACGEAASVTLKLQNCTSCRAVAYCGRACQRSHWRQHKRRCKEIKAARITGVLRQTRNWNFFMAAQVGDMAAVRALVEAGADVEELDDKGLTPAFGATNGGHMEILNYLEECGASLSCRSYGGAVLFHGAAFNGKFNMLNYLYTLTFLSQFATCVAAAPLASRLADQVAWSRSALRRSS